MILWVVLGLWVDWIGRPLLAWWMGVSGWGCWVFVGCFVCVNIEVGRTCFCLSGLFDFGFFDGCAFGCFGCLDVVMGYTCFGFWILLVGICNLGVWGVVVGVFVCVG